MLGRLELSLYAIVTLAGALMFLWGAYEAFRVFTPG